MRPLATTPRPFVLGEGRLRFTSPFVLAPMEGVTHRAFRDVVMDLGGVGAAWTEFIRISSHVLKPKALARELGPPRDDAPVGVQLMATDANRLADTARNAVVAGAPMIDLNFGCPAPTVFKKCAGSALLDHPERLEDLVRATSSAVEVPVTAKIRLGVSDMSRLRDVVLAVEAGGAAALTVHARTRADGYAHPARWERLSDVRAMTRLPLIGNGDVLSVDDALRMIRDHGVDGVMIGRGALRDPWIFARLRARLAAAPEPAVAPSDVIAFYVRYRDEMARYGNDRGRLSNLKQLFRRLDVGVRIDDAARLRLLRSRDLAEFDAELRAIADS